MQIHTNQGHITAAAQNLDHLAESARVDLADLMAITSKSRSTIYRWIDLGILPKPRKFAGTQNSWTVGEVRRALSAQ